MYPPHGLVAAASRAIELDDLSLVARQGDEEEEDAFAEPSSARQERQPLIQRRLSFAESSASGSSTPRKSKDRPYSASDSFSGPGDSSRRCSIIHVGREEGDGNSPVNRAMEKIHNSKLAHIASKLAVSHEPGLSNTQLLLTNEDLKPVEPERRQWGAWNFVGFWVADSFNINTWMISSSMVVAGLSWWQSWICVWIGYAIAACFVCLTGRIGATYHIGFPVVNRASFGIWGSLWPVFNRAAMACVWYGVQAWIGGNCVQLMIRAIWNSWNPKSPEYRDTMAGSGTNVVDFVSFFLFWAGSLPAIWFPVHKIRHLFTVKAFFVPTAAVAFFIWILVRAKGAGPVIRQGNTIHGSDLAWEVIKGIMSSIANFATLIVNDPDFARFAGKPRDALWSQLFTIPAGFAATSFIGIMVSSASVVVFDIDEPVWNPLEVLNFLLDEGGSGQRFGVFVISAAFALAQLGTNIAANSVSAGTDLTALMPRFINIRRGGYLCATVGLAMCPWNLLSSSNQFTTYLSAYSVFLSSIAGVMVSDYYFVRKGYLQIRELYSARRTDPYFFTWGIHWRGYAAYIAGILINVVGFAGAVGTPVPIGATYVYNLNFFCGFIVASATYWALCRFFPIPATSDVWMEVGDEIRNPSLAYDNESDPERFQDMYDEAQKGQEAGGLGRGSESKQF